MAEAQTDASDYTEEDAFSQLMQTMRQETDRADSQSEAEQQKTLELFRQAQKQISDQAEARLRLQDRFSELENMTDGWLDGKGKAPTSFALVNARATLGALLEAGAPTGRLYPQEDGGIQVEWSLTDIELSVSFGRDQGAYIHSMDTSGERTQHYYSSRRDPTEAAQILLGLGLQDLSDDIGQLLRRWEQENSRFGAVSTAQRSSSYRELLRRPREQVMREALMLLAEKPSMTLLALLDALAEAAPAENTIGLVPAAHAWMQWGRERGLLDIGGD